MLWTAWTDASAVAVALGGARQIFSSRQLFSRDGYRHLSENASISTLYELHRILSILAE
jgi:hypothetical protein